MDLTNLRKLINDSGMTSDSISDASGVNVQTIKKYYRTNDGNPQADFLMKLADFFAVPLDYLCGRCTKEECAAIEESFADNFRLLRKETYESDCIVTISEFILKFPNLSVGDIKKKFRLTSKEYEMIFDLCGFKKEKVNV